MGLAQPQPEACFARGPHVQRAGLQRDAAQSAPIHSVALHSAALHIIAQHRPVLCGVAVALHMQIAT
eukprot:1643289-Pyramimonas_sp.AAC.1